MVSIKVVNKCHLTDNFVLFQLLLNIIRCIFTLLDFYQSELYIVGFL